MPKAKRLYCDLTIDEDSSGSSRVDALTNEEIMQESKIQYNLPLRPLYILALYFADSFRVILSQIHSETDFRNIQQENKG